VRSSCAVPPLHLVSDDAVLSREGFEAAARSALEAGRGAVALHLRGRTVSARRLHALAMRLRPAATAVGAWLVVNDRVDVARAAGADGVQLGARSLTPADARGAAGGVLRFGVSVHAAEPGRAAAAAGAAWLLVGTLWPTPSHPGRSGAGVGLLRALAGAGAPRIGIGGVSAARLGEVRAAGADGAAVLRAVWDAADPARAVRELLDAWRAA
jgi:thiamine-phosphate diphosphorylase